MKRIKGIGEELREGLRIEVGGEIYMGKKSFGGLNVEGEGDGLEGFGNGRNGGGG